MGRLYYEAISGTPDEMVIVALTFVFTLLYVGARMILEILYVTLNPGEVLTMDVKRLFRGF